MFPWVFRVFMIYLVCNRKKGDVMLMVRIKNIKTFSVISMTTALLVVATATICFAEDSSKSSYNIVSRLQQKQANLMAFREDAAEIQTSTLARRPLFYKRDLCSTEDEKNKEKNNDK